MAARHTIFLVQAQALLAVRRAGEKAPKDEARAPDGKLADTRTLPLAALAKELMTRERRRWLRLASSWDSDETDVALDSLQARSIAPLALLGADSDAEAQAVLRRVPELHDDTARRLRAIATAIKTLYPPGDWGAPRIRPDMMGEWFVVDQFARDPGFADSLCENLTDSQAARALAFLSRAVDTLSIDGPRQADDPDAPSAPARVAMRLFGQFAGGSIRRQVLAATLAAHAGEGGSLLLDEAVAGQLPSPQEWTLEGLEELDARVPPGVLPCTAAMIAGHLVTLYRGLADANPGAYRPELATALNGLALRLSMLGLDQEALDATSQAIGIRRELAAGNHVHAAELGSDLTTLGAQLSQLGRNQEAVSITGEAIALLKTSDRTADKATLAEAIGNLAMFLSRQGRNQEALDAAQKAVDLHRTLTTDGQVTYQHGLARALTNLASRLQAQDQYRQALEAGREALQIYRTTAESGSVADQAGLAAGLANLGSQLSELKQDKEALREAIAVTRQALDIRRALAAGNPAAHRPQIARILNQLGDLLERDGQFRESCNVTREAILAHRILEAGRRLRQVELPGAWLRLARQLNRLEQHQEALQAARQALKLSRSLAADNPAHTSGLVSTLQGVAWILANEGQPNEASGLAHESVAIQRTLTADNPAAQQPVLARALTNLCAVLNRCGQNKEALDALRDAVDLQREMAARDPERYAATYRQNFGSLQRAYAQRGMLSDALALGLPEALQSHSCRCTKAVLRCTSI